MKNSKIKNKKYIILEIIPTAVDPKNGVIAQLSALKLNGIILEDRFDYRLNEDKINNFDIIKMLQYDKDMFEYVNNTKDIIKNFKKWISDYDLLIIDNAYTKNYLENIKNNKESIFDYLNMNFSDNVIDEMMNKYQLQPSNHIVDLLYEAIIEEENIQE
jgi:DNA polymerase III alpha subunit (gram-positive type)